MLSKDDIGVDRLVRHKINDCEVYIAEKKGKVIIIALYRGIHSLYFKVTPSYAGSWDCEELEYYPFGYYGFIRDEKELVPKLLEKISELEKNELI
ncbi:hypothetical protein SUSAZ_04525 [Sulfolobus acidocaldarius SUSAZ]|nr:hypothetical protein SUSAZ_04525 [Sulfolobus acidocaldarius SUSAZ]